MDHNKLSKNNFPVIDLGDYILREQTMDDLYDFYEYYTDPEVNEFIVSDIPKTIEEGRSELQYWINIYYNGAGIYFGIARKDNKQLIGSIGITGVNRIHNRAEVSYDLSKEHWNRGIMTKALKAMVKYSFEEMKINRLEAFALPDNKPSRALLKKCNFELEGELKHHRRHNGIYKDIGIFSMIYSDYLKIGFNANSHL